MPIKPAGAFKPGSIVPASGFVQIPGVEGEKTVVRGRRFPPSNKPGEHYVYTAVPIRRVARDAAPIDQLPLIRFDGAIGREAA